MAVHIDVWADFTCPFCFLTTARLERFAQEIDVAVRWRSFVQCLPGTPPLSLQTDKLVYGQYGGVKAELEREFGLKANPGPLGISSLNTHVAAKYSESQNKASEFHAAATTAYWLKALSVDNRHILQNLVEQIGLSQDDLSRRWEDVTFQEAIRADGKEAARHGIRAIPTLVFNEQVMIVGAPPLSVLRDALLYLRPPMDTLGSLARVG
jgi:predicted DsbA family dithiol-disulfide isomerase